MQVAQFVEKPDSEKATQFVANGYLWNSGMFVFKGSAFMAMLKKYQPTIYQQIHALQPDNLAQQYADLPNLSMDYGLAEEIVKQADKVAVVPVDMAWSDLGSWDSIYAKRDKDDSGNVKHGEVYCEDTENSLVWASRGVIATMGLKNIAVIQTTDATMVIDRSRAEDIKSLVEKIKQNRSELTELHRTVHRPWGTYTVLEESANFKIKRIVVNPGAKLSMQLHKHRAEHWVVVSGVATITNNEIEFTLNENQSTYISKTHKHRLENKGSEPLAIIEVQCGDYVGEDDIVRFDDSYGRVD